MPKSKSSFAYRLRNVRELSGLTQTELGAKADIDQALIAHFEGGRREPNLENFVRLVKALGISADVLLGTSRP
jgi:transcriptional regulator with XRE-family HTH domain